MKILQISPQISFPPNSGGRLSIYGITKSLSERGHEITFVCYIENRVSENDTNELKKICNPFFIDWDVNNKIRTAIPNLFSKTPYNISKYYSKKLESFIYKYFESNKVDVVHIDHLHMSWVIDVIRKISDVPVILREHNLELKIMKRYFDEQTNIMLKYYAGIQLKKFTSYEPNQCEKFDSCLMVTEEDEKSILNYNPRIKTKVIPIGVDKKIFDMRKSDIIPYSIFHIGSLEWQPNYDGLLWFIKNVYPTIVEKFPMTKLYVYSKGTERLKISNKQKENIIIRGYVDNIWEEVLDKQVLIVPLSVGSGMRVKIVEMLAAGQLIVSTSIGKEGIDISDGKHIFIADSCETFIQKIIDIFENRINIDSIIRNGKNIIKEKYSWEKIAEDIEIEYLKSINKKENSF